MKYTQEYRIYENDVDFRKMATLGSLLRYCQQIGTEDAEHYGITPELYASTHTPNGRMHGWILCPAAVCAAFTHRTRA